MTKRNIIKKLHKLGIQHVQKQEFIYVSLERLKKAELTKILKNVESKHSSE